MYLSAEGSGLIPSDLDAERGLVGCLIVHPRCNASLPVEQFFDSRLRKFYALIQAIRAAGPHRERPALRVARIENVMARSCLRWTAADASTGFRVSRGGLIQSDRTSCPTGQPVQSTRTGRTPLT